MQINNEQAVMPATALMPENAVKPTMNLKELVKAYTRMLERNSKKLKEHQATYADTAHLTFHAGFDQGYLTAKVSMLEDILDELNNI